MLHHCEALFHQYLYTFTRALVGVPSVVRLPIHNSPTVNEQPGLAVQDGHALHLRVLIELRGACTLCEQFATGNPV